MGRESLAEFAVIRSLELFGIVWFSALSKNRDVRPWVCIGRSQVVRCWYHERKIPALCRSESTGAHAATAMHEVHMKANDAHASEHV